MFALLILQAAVTCSTVGGVTTCQEKPGTQAPDYGAALRQGYGAMPTYRSNRSEREQRDARLLRARVGGMVADGRCDDARTAALKAGDFDLAEQVKASCQ